MAEVFWAMTHLKWPPKPGGFFTGTFLTRQEAIKFAVWNYGRSWEKLYRETFRIVKVRVNESATGNYWALKNIGRFRILGGGFFVGTFGTRKETIRQAEKDYGRPWEKLYRDGYRAVRVNVTEIR